MTRLLYTLYNESIFDTDIYRISDVLKHLFVDSSQLLFIGKGKLNPDEKIINYKKLFALLNQEIGFKVLLKQEDNYEIIVLIDLQSTSTNGILSLIQSYANSVLLNTKSNEETETLTNLYQRRTLHSKYRLKYYSNYLSKGLEMNNIQH